MHCHVQFHVVLLFGEIPQEHHVFGEGVGPHAARVDAERKVRELLETNRGAGARLWSMHVEDSTYDLTLTTRPQVKHRGWRPKGGWRRKFSQILTGMFT